MPNAVEVASLYATLSLNDTMTRGLNNANRATSGFVSGMERFGARMTGIGASMGMAFAPVTNFLQSGINVAADFEAVMNEVQARTGLTGDEMERVSDLALQMGADTAYSAQQAGEAFLQLLSSGQTLEQAVGTLPNVLNAAAAGGLALGTAADVVTDVLSIFGLEVESASPMVTELARQMGISQEKLEELARSGTAASPEIKALADAAGVTADEMLAIIKQEDAATVVESLARASGSSSATMQDLADALVVVGPLAAQLGMNVNETTAALAVLAENGIKGSEAGTALRSMLTNMTSTTRETQDAWAELGVSMFDAQGNAREMDTVLGELKAALEVLPAEDQNRLMSALAGTYGRTALAALTGSLSISEMETAMAGAASAADIAETRMSGWVGANDALQGSLETLQIEVLTPLLQNVLTPLVEKLTEVVNSVTDWATQNPELATTVATVLAGLVALIGVLMPLGIIISTVGTAASALAAGFGLVATGVAAIAGPMMAAIGPILAVGAAIAAVIAQVNEFNRIAGQGAAVAGQAAIDSGADQLAIDYAAWLATEGTGMLAGIGASPHFAASTAANAGINYDWNAGWSNWADFNAGLTPDDIRGRATGGPVSGGMPYLVGERGPELFMPAGNGRIVPNHALGGGGVTVVVNSYGQTPYDFATLVERALRDKGF